MDICALLWLVYVLLYIEIVLFGDPLDFCSDIHQKCGKTQRSICTLKIARSWFYYQIEISKVLKYYTSSTQQGLHHHYLVKRLKELPFPMKSISYSSSFLSFSSNFCKNNPVSFSRSHRKFIKLINVESLLVRQNTLVFCFLLKWVPYVTRSNNWKENKSTKFDLYHK